MHERIDLGIAPADPGRGDGEAVVGADDGERICEFDLLSFGYAVDVDVFAYQPLEFLFDPWRQEEGADVEIFEESVEMAVFVEEAAIYSAQVPAEPFEGRYLVDEEGHGLLCVVQRVVAFVAVKFVILEQFVVGLVREQQRGQVQGVDKDVVLSAQFVLEVFEVVLYDIVPAQILAAGYELVQGLQAGCVDGGPVRLCGADVRDLSVAGDLKVDECDIIGQSGCLFACLVANIAKIQFWCFLCCSVLS